jgi:hypothetical protein
MSHPAAHAIFVFDKPAVLLPEIALGEDLARGFGPGAGFDRRNCHLGSPQS